MHDRDATPPPLDRATRRTIAQRYARRFDRSYAQGKLAGDPVYAAVAERLADAPALPLRRLRHGPARPVSARLRPAARLSRHRPRPPSHRRRPHRRGHVALLDMLHYLPAGKQVELLRQAGARLAPGGLLLIRNVLREANWRFHATRAEEWFLRVGGRMRTGAQHYPDAAGIRAPLEALGLAVTIRPLYGRTPFNSYLAVARHLG